MIHEVLTTAEFAPDLCSGAKLTTYARPNEGFLAEEGGRWGVIVLPGGGYQVNAKSEGEPVALAFLAAGVQAFLLEYSVAPVRWPQQFLEVAAAIAWLREHAEEYGVAPDRIAVCGFSAGGHLAGCAANLWQHDEIRNRLGFMGEEARPDAAILCYPVITMGEYGSVMTRGNLFGEGSIVPETSLENSVSTQNPPTFLWCTYTDSSVPMENSLMYANALRGKNVPFEMHIFGKGPHAMGLATGESAWRADHTDLQASNWHSLCVNWLKGLK